MNERKRKHHVFKMPTLQKEKEKKPCAFKRADLRNSCFADSKTEIMKVYSHLKIILLGKCFNNCKHLRHFMLVKVRLLKHPDLFILQADFFFWLTNNMSQANKKISLALFQDVASMLRTKIN